MTADPTFDSAQLQRRVESAASALDVPGVAVGIYQRGWKSYAAYGVTSVENRLRVDKSTLFQYGSTHKTFTATAVMCLVEQGLVELTDKVRSYIPELRTKDERVAREVTVLQLLNHTSGWFGDPPERCGDGDDCRARFISTLSKLDQLMPLGFSMSYNNAAMIVAGHLLEKVTGCVYEEAITQLICEPLGLKNTFLTPNDVMTRRFAVGHHHDDKGTISVVRPWASPRAGAPHGGWGVCASIEDQLAWAIFHLGDGTAANGSRLMSHDLLESMKQPTVRIPGANFGDAVGISWLLREIDGVRVVAHGGTTTGQYSQLLIVPDRDFAFVCLSNSRPNGAELTDSLERWALKTYVGLVDPVRDPLPLSKEILQEYEGVYETPYTLAEVKAGEGNLQLTLTVKAAIRRFLQFQGTDLPRHSELQLGIIDLRDSRYVVTSEAAKGLKGCFIRGPSRRIEALHIRGRIAMRKRDE